MSKMRGLCGSEFKPYTSGCEDCSYYSYCMKMYKEFMEKENAPGGNYPLRPFEQEIKNNQEKFKKYRPISDADIIIFRKELDDMSADQFIKVLELYREEK
jgi:hypothetical protein